MRSSTWACPIVQRTTWSVSVECSIRIVTSSATRRCSAPPSLSSSDLVAARIATGSWGSGSPSWPVRLEERGGERADPLVVVVRRVAGDLVPDEVAEMSRHVDRFVDAQGAREDAHEGQAPDVGVGRGAYDLGDEGL